LEVCMFFPEKIKSISPSDRVLEIGPGGTPYFRSHVFLERQYDNEAEWKVQRGGTDKLETSKPIIFYEGIEFPFRDKEFDYVICSHVIEHVEDIEGFLSEVFRIASRGYIEYPTIYYEYLYNFPAHLNFIKQRGNDLVYLTKSKTNFHDFKPVQAFFLESLDKGHKKLVDDLKEYMFEGFEWKCPFAVREAGSISDLIWTEFSLPDGRNCSHNRSLLRTGLIKFKGLLNR
jgi:SAM-dependent methyltransferase